MPLEIRYRGDLYELDAAHGRTRHGDAALRRVEEAGAGALLADWRDAGRRIAGIRRRQGLMLGGLGAAGAASAAVLLRTAGDGSGAETALAGLLGGLAVASVAVWWLPGRAMARAIGSLEASAALLADLAATDPLTELPNHRAFHERLVQEVAQAERSGRPLALVLLDLDHFKRINDEHGHPAGDEVVSEVARRLAACARRGEIVARVGGEEFAWLLPGADGMDGWQAAERARLAVSGAPVCDLGKVTISAGVCELRQAGSARELHRLADGALYWAKAHGRDRSVRYSPDVVEELSAAERAARLERQQALNAVHALARAVDAKDPYTQRHSERVADIAVRLALELGWRASRLAELREAAVLHDVGKIAVPDAILTKPGRLTDDEFALVREHPSRGAEIVSGALTAEQVSWVRGHHERHDGGGYPDGLAGEAVPDGARVMAVADAWDAMTSDRPYRAGLSAPRALEICRQEAGAQFAPEVVAALGRLWEQGAVPHAEPEPEPVPSALVYRGAETVPVARRDRRPAAAPGMVYRGTRVPEDEGPGAGG
jgi:diguanylate cyclase (GGDEF)-like protein